MEKNHLKSILVLVGFFSISLLWGQGGDPPYTLTLQIVESGGTCGPTSGCSLDNTVCFDIILADFRNNSGAQVDPFYSNAYNLWISYPADDFSILDGSGDPMDTECVNTQSGDTDADFLGGFRVGASDPNAMVSIGSILHSFCLEYTDISVLTGAQICVGDVFFGVESTYRIFLGSNPSTAEEATTDDGTLILNPGCITLGSGNISCLAILPVTWASFEAEKQGQMADLDWVTATELHTDHFVVERSTDGRTFEEIGAVAGAGTSYDERAYGFMDTKPARGTNYYRIKQVDTDGNFEYSTIRSLHFDSSEEIVVFPNPAKKYVDIIVPDTEPRNGDLLDVEIYNSQGLLVKIVALSQRASIDLSLLPSGAYQFKIMDGDNLVGIKQVVKME